jgi:hypothetical protein
MISRLRPLGSSPVQAAAAIVGVDAAGLLMERVRAVRQATAFDPVEDLVELLFTDQERVVLRVGRCTGSPMR